MKTEPKSELSDIYAKLDEPLSVTFADRFEDAWAETHDDLKKDKALALYFFTKGEQGRNKFRIALREALQALERIQDKETIEKVRKILE